MIRAACLIAVACGRDPEPAPVEVVVPAEPRLQHVVHVRTSTGANTRDVMVDRDAHAMHVVDRRHGDLTGDHERRLTARELDVLHADVVAALAESDWLDEPAIDSERVEQVDIVDGATTLFRVDAHLDTRDSAAAKLFTDVLRLAE